MRRTLASAALVLAMASAAHAARRPKPVKIYIMAGQSNAVGHAHNRFLADNRAS